LKNLTQVVKRTLIKLKIAEMQNIEMEQMMQDGAQKIHLEGQEKIQSYFEKIPPGPMKEGVRAVYKNKLAQDLKVNGNYHRISMLKEEYAKGVKKGDRQRMVLKKTEEKAQEDYEKYLEAMSKAERDKEVQDKNNQAWIDITTQLIPYIDKALRAENSGNDILRRKAERKLMAQPDRKGKKNCQWNNNKKRLIIESNELRKLKKTQLRAVPPLMLRPDLQQVGEPFKMEAEDRQLIILMYQCGIDNN
jgi:hypothetical protein